MSKLRKLNNDAELTALRTNGFYIDRIRSGSALTVYSIDSGVLRDKDWKLIKTGDTIVCLDEYTVSNMQGWTKERLNLIQSDDYVKVVFSAQASRASAQAPRLSAQAMASRTSAGADNASVEGAYYKQK